MVQKKRFILKIPYFLATPVAPVMPKVILASCYAAMIVGYVYPLVGTLIASAYCLTIWQFIKINYKDQPQYNIYTRFLLQRVLFCLVFVAGLLFASMNLDNSYFNVQTWSLVYFVLGVLNLSDIFYTLKGLVGVGYIHENKYNK